MRCYRVEIVNGIEENFVAYFRTKAQTKNGVIRAAKKALAEKYNMDFSPKVWNIDKYLRHSKALISLEKEFHLWRDYGEERFLAIQGNNHCIMSSTRRGNREGRNEQ